MLRRTFLTLAVWTISVIAAVPAGALEDFAFVHITDVHVEPHLLRTGPPGPVRGHESIQWIVREAVGPQDAPGLEPAWPAPAFGLVTGDLTEYGVIDDTWSVFEKTFAPLPYPLHVTPGNHDNTWVAMYDVMRQRHGGENYSFDQFGCHFVCLCSASPQEPVPSLDAKTRAWLRKDLARTAPGTPILMALHHPPDSGELATPAEYDTFIDLLRDYNVVLVLYGHGHAVQHKNMDGIDGIMGGSTYGKNAGYGLVSVQDNKLRVAYRYQHRPGKDGEKPGGPGWRTLLEKPLATSTPERLFKIASPAEDSHSADGQLTLSIETAKPVRAVVRIDGRDVQTLDIEPPGSQTTKLDVAKLTPGAHLLSVHATAKDGRTDIRTRTFLTTAETAAARWRQEFPAAFKAAPVVVGDRVIVAGTDGVVTALQRDSGRRVWSFASGAEILGTPAWTGEKLVFGSGDGKVYALDHAGKPAWVFDTDMPVYGAPLIDNGTAIIGDNGGRLHALDLRDGKPRWTFKRADYAIECQPCHWGDLIVFGAWDGHLYAVGRQDGQLAWKVPGPKSSDGKGVRYYAPADCGPGAIGDSLFVCDRGYLLGTYSRDGAYGGQMAKGVSGIAVDEPSGTVFARSNADKVYRFSADGSTVWEASVPAGRFPIPPTLRGESVYVCSNQGRLSVLDATGGHIRWSYQATPGFYVMAPVTVDDSGTCYVAGMDGSVTAVRQVGKQRSEAARGS